MIKLYYVILLMLILSQVLYSEIMILNPKTAFNACNNEPLLIHWNTDEPVIIEVRTIQEKEFTPISENSIKGGYFSWYVNHPKFLNIPMIIKVINASDENDYDMVSNIIVYQETMIYNQSKSAVYCEGENVNLNIEADGYNLKYKWYRDGIILENENKNVLNLYNIQYGKAATYQCEIIGELDCNTIKSDPIAVYLATPTEITEQPLHSGWKLGAHVSFSVGVHVNGNGEDQDIKFQWYKGKVQLKDSFSLSQLYQNKWRIVGTHSPTLEFIYAFPEDQSDSIYCVVTGRCGSAKTRYVKLKENAFFKYKVLTPEITKCAGDSAVLKIQVTQTEPGTLLYQWYRTGNRKIYDNERISGAETPVLTIRNCIDSDLGTYCLKIIHLESGYTLTTSVISLYIEGIPKVGTHLVDYTVYDRRNTPSGYGIIKLAVGSLLMVNKYYFEWFRNDTLILKGNGMAGAELIISNPTLSDEGKYYCKITGICDFACTDTINVSIGYQDILSCHYSDTVLSVRKHKLDTGQMQYYWMFKNKKIKEEGRYKGSATRNLTIQSLTISQQGEYSSYAVDTILNKTYYNGFVFLDVAEVPNILKVYYDTLLYMNIIKLPQKMMYVITKNLLKIELYKDTVLYKYRYFNPENWMLVDVTLYIGCPSDETSCFCGILPTGNYQFRFINYCGETWSKKFTVINTDSLYGIAKLPNQNDSNIGSEITSDLVEITNPGDNENDELTSLLQDSIQTGFEYKNNSEILFPNPARDYIHIQPSEGLKHSEGYDIQIFDMLGTVVATIHPMTGSHRMNIANLSPGVYFIKIGNRVEKFVKM